MRHVIKVSLLLTVALLGCSGGSKGPPTAQISGEVKRGNGQPIGEVSVVFYPEKGTTAATKTDPSGRFTATVSLGLNKVAVISESSASSNDTSPEAAQKQLDTQGKIKPEYANPESSGLTVTVKEKHADKVLFVVE